MKRITLLLFVAAVFFMAQNAFPQVFADFEDASLDMQGFWYGWGNAGSNFQRVDDATFEGVLSMDINVTTPSGDDAKAAIGGPDPLPLGWTEMKEGAYFLTFDVYVPADFPDSAQVKLWGQDKVNWTWNDIKYSAMSDWGRPLKKGEWNTLTFPVKRINQMNPGFVPWNAKGGIEFWFGVAWTGIVYIDNAALWGVEPKLEADFEDAGLGEQGFWYGWGNAGSNFQRVDDATYGGVLSMDLNVVTPSGDDAKAAIGGPDPLPLYWTETMEGAAFFTMDIFVPADFPDSAQVKFWSQDKINWTWNDIKYSAMSDWGRPLKKGEWNTLAFPVKRARQLNSGYAPWNAKGGVEFWFGVTWSGTVLIDNFKVYTMEVGKKWVLADFEIESKGTQGFANTGWNHAMTAITWAADPSARTAGVLQTDWNSSLDLKAQFVNNNIDLKWTDTDTGATAMTVDVWVPTDIPAGTNISFWATDKVSWSWTETNYTITDSTVVPGEWNTITYNVKDYLASLDPKGVIRAGLQIVFSDSNWTGSIYWDNYTLVGIEKPVGALQSPAASFTTAVSDDGYPTTTGYNYVQVTWVDNADNLNETYNVYMSKEPITDLSAEGVVRIGTQIPRGNEHWNHRPYSTDGAEQTFYFAVTATGLDGIETEMSGDNTTGPATVVSTMAPKAIYDPNFNFQIDGSLGEFTAYADYTLITESVGVDNAGDWSPTSTDLNFSVSFVIDDDYLYMGANIIDDDLATSGQAWEGDALELFMGFYPIASVKEWHTLGDIGTAGTGDYRISFTSWGETHSGGSSPFTYPGLTYLVLPNPTGYLIEAKLDLDSLSAAGYTPQVGDMLPLKIDVNDKDEVLDGSGTGRTKQLHHSGFSNTENWKRPSCWGYLAVSLPTGVADRGLPSIPMKTQLYANYPNPFNPTTTLKYDLAKASHVSMVIYNMLGQKIRTLVNVEKPAGYHSAIWDGTNDGGENVASGIYFFEFKADSYVKTNKMILMK